ncbi:MAG: hypothetical protein ACLFU4_02060 [Opitutales bacterium]
MTARPQPPFAAGLALALFFALLPKLAANSVSDLSIDNDGGFVLAAHPDAADDRDFVQTSFTHEATGEADETYDYRYVVALRDQETNDVVAEGLKELDDEALSGSGSASLPIDVSLEISSPPLNPDHSYAAEIMQVDRRKSGENSWESIDVSGTTTSSPLRLIHFTNEDPDDAAVNVISTLQGVAIQESALVDTVDDYDHFVARVDAEFHRWDNFNQSTPPSDSVTVQYQIKLLSESGEEIPLENDGIVEETYPLASFEAGSPRNPSQTTFANQILPFRPAGQMDSVSSDYSIAVSIQHIEISSDPSGSLKKGNRLDTNTERFIHANGTVRFGDITTTITGLEERPVLTGGPSGGILPVAFAVSAEGGFIDGSEDLVFGEATLPLELDSGGEAVYNESTTAAAARPSSDYTLREQGSFRFEHRKVELSSSGANGSIEVFLPAGTGLLGHDNEFDRPESIASPSQALQVAQFDKEIFPEEETLSFSYGSTTYLSSEQFPLLYELDQLTWDLGQDEITVATSAVVSAQGHRYDYLADPSGGVIPNPEAIIKRSNQYYLRDLDPALNSPVVTIRSNKDNGATLVSLSAPLNLGAGSHKAHFPLGLEFNYGSGELDIRESRVRVGQSFLNASSLVEQSYASGCPTADCPTGALSITSRLDVGAIHFTPEGGLYAIGTLVDSAGTPEPEILQWGRNDSGGFTHKAIAFEEATFYSAGYMLAANHFPEKTEDAAARLLLSGLDLEEPQNSDVMERPGSSAYVDGLGDYPGFNFRVPGDDGALGRSVLAGETFEFGLTDRSKFYTRQAGVAGIHEAVEFEASKKIYGYPFKFANFGLSFLSGENFDSRVNGQVDVVHPGQFTQEFENLMVTCTGGLDSAEPPEGDPTKTLAYWRADFDTFAIQFEPDGDDPCDTTAGYLTLGIGTTPRTFAMPLFGVVGFFNDGEMIALENSHLTDQSGAPAEVDSRLIAPARLSIQGPGAESYSLEPVADVYFNSHALRDTENEEPYFSLAAGMGVPFFDRLQTQIHFATRSLGEEEEEPDPGVYYVMGGWPTEGWRDGDDHFFSQASFDRANRGYPDGETLDFYRNPSKDDNTHETYLARARKQWLGVVPFDYPLRWNAVNRAFRSPRNVENDLLVLELEHQIRYLSAENAELVFGASYDGLPQINGANLVFEAADEKLGAAQSFIDGAGEDLYELLTGGVDSFARILNDKVQDLFRNLFDDGIDPILDDLADEINDYLQTAVDESDGALSEIQGEYNGRISDIEGGLDEWDALLAGLENDVEGKRDELKAKLEELLGQADDASQAPGNLINELTREVKSIQNSIRSLKPGTVELNLNEEDVEGLLSRGPDGQGREFLENIIEELIGQEISGFVMDEVEEPLEDLLAKADPTIEQINLFLDDIDQRLDEIIDGLEEKGEAVDDFAKEIRSKLAEAEAEINEVIDTVFDELLARLEQLPRNDLALEELYWEDDPIGGHHDPEEIEAMKEELKAFLRESFEDAFFDSQIIRRYHAIVRERLQDIYLQKQEVVDTLFAEVNQIVKDLIAETVGRSEEEINEALGDLGDKIGAGEVDGFAHIQGDALRLLRLDGVFELQVPDEMTLRAYLQIQQLRSDGSAGCAGPAGGRAVEVSLGTIDMPVEWISPGLRADIDTKFSFDTSDDGAPALLGMGGAFAITEGEIGFESFVIKDLAAAMAFSAWEGNVQEAYLSAALGLEFGDYEASGGIFFGRTCTLEPILIWDEDVAAVLNEPDPTFTGAYVYGEAWIPVGEAILGIPASCMFDISAGIGAGAFFFQEGPVYGGKVFAGLSGRILCVVNGSGEITMVGSRDGAAGTTTLYGTGFVKGEVSLGVKTIDKRVDVTASYADSVWDIDFD